MPQIFSPQKKVVGNLQLALSFIFFFFQADLSRGFNRYLIRYSFGWFFSMFARISESEATKKTRASWCGKDLCMFLVVFWNIRDSCSIY